MCKCVIHFHSNLSHSHRVDCRKQRFYLYSRRLPSDLQDIDRDVFNEKPSKEDIIAVPEGQGNLHTICFRFQPKQIRSFFQSLATGIQKLYNSATLHTSRGDIHLKLFATECPKTVENFCVHSKNGYYNGHIFHRVIKGK